MLKKNCDNPGTPENGSKTAGIPANQAGAMVGLQFRGEVFHIMPTVDISRSVVDLTSNEKGDTGTTKKEAEEQITYVIFGVTFGWVGGQELKKLKKIDKQLDRMEKKMDAASAAPPRSRGAGRAGRRARQASACRGARQTGHRRRRLAL